MILRSPESHSISGTVSHPFLCCNEQFKRVNNFISIRPLIFNEKVLSRAPKCQEHKVSFSEPRVHPLKKVPVQNIPNSSGAKILDQSKDQHRAAGHRRRIDVREGAYCGLEAPVGTLGDWRRQFSSRETGRGGTLNQPWSTSRYDHHCALQVLRTIQNIQWALQTLCFEYFLVGSTVTI